MKRHMKRPAPPVGSRWKDYAGPLYQVVLHTNVGSNNSSHPESVVCRDLKTKAHFSITVDEWYDRMIPLPDDASGPLFAGTVRLGDMRVRFVEAVYLNGEKVPHEVAVSDFGKWVDDLWGNRHKGSVNIIWKT